MELAWGASWQVLGRPSHAAMIQPLLAVVSAGMRWQLKPARPGDARRTFSPIA